MAFWVKGRLKQALLMLPLVVFPSIHIQGLIRFIAGDVINLFDFTAVILFIYGCINIIYVCLSTEKNSIRSEINDKTPDDYKSVISNAPPVLAQKNYTGTPSIRRSPQKPEQKTQINPTIISSSNPNKTTLPEAPPLEVNFESAQEFMDDPIPEKEYDGIVDEDDSSSIKNTSSSGGGLLDEDPFLIEPEKKTRLL